jgi:hypothetical protein
VPIAALPLSRLRVDLPQPVSGARLGPPGGIRREARSRLTSFSRRAAHPTRPRPLPGRARRRLPAGRQGQPASPARPAGRAAVAADPGAGPHPRARPWPRRAADPEGRHRRRPVVPARRPGDPGHPPRPPGRRPPLAHRHRVRGHQPNHLPGKPHPPGRLPARALGIEALHHIRDVTFTEDASTARTGRLPARWPACATSPSARCG